MLSSCVKFGLSGLLSNTSSSNAPNILFKKWLAGSSWLCYTSDALLLHEEAPSVLSTFTLSQVWLYHTMPLFRRSPAAQTMVVRVGADIWTMWRSSHSMHYMSPVSPWNHYTSKSDTPSNSVHYASPVSPGSHYTSQSCTSSYSKCSGSPVGHRSHCIDHVKI